MRRAVAVVWLVGLWLLLWRDLSVANVASGAVVAAIAVSWSSSPPVHRVRPLAVVGLTLHFLRRLVEANLVLAREVVTPQNHINTGIVAVPLPGYSDLLVTMVANATSLTPGTLTLEVDREPDPVLYVHVLHLRTPEEARQDVRDLADRFAHAFPTAAAGRVERGADPTGQADRNDPDPTEEGAP